MSVSQLALAISAAALAVSICVPIVQWRIAAKRTIASQRTLLLQRILDAKSVTFISMHELIELLRRHREQMDPEQLTNLEEMVPRMRLHHDVLEKLHDDWSDFDDGASLAEIEKSISSMHTATSEARDTAKLIENGRKSYEDT